MAWISVHESVDGSKLREFHKKLGCSKFEALGILNFLWFWGLSNADKYGVILHVDREDIERYLYGVGVGCKLAPKDILDALFETGWLDQTQNGIYIHDWETWQEQWYKAKERRESDSRRKRESRKKVSVSGELVTGNATEDDSDDEDVDNNASEGTKYTPAFLQFWEAYPRKIGKGEAYKKYNARRNDGFSDAELVAAAKNYALQVGKAKTDKQYIKHPKTFLGDALPFVDYLSKNCDSQSAESVPKGGNPFSNWENDN